MLDKAKIIAIRSKHKRHKVGCIITDKKGNILSTGWNVKHKTHPIQKKYNELAGVQTGNHFLHAEIHAIVRSTRSNKIPYAIYVARITKAGATGLASPCRTCQLAIEEAGIKEVHYTL